MSNDITIDHEVLLVLAMQEKDERASPLVIGAFNEELMYSLPQEDYDKQINKLKETWTMDPNDYDWRELRVAVPVDALKKLFQPTPLVAKILEEE